MEEYSKKNLDELFNYATKILAEIKNSSNEKDVSLEKAKRRYDNLRGNLKDILNKSED